MTHFNRIRDTRYTRYEVYEVYESSADAAYKATALCLGTVPVVGYSYNGWRGRFKFIYYFKGSGIDIT
jgi:hypothetical protein